MGTLYDKLLSLQYISNTYDDWTEYRTALTDCILRNTEKDSYAIMVGVGECNDFDLKKLTGHFSKVVLLDHNEEAMHEGLKQRTSRLSRPI